MKRTLYPKLLAGYLMYGLIGFLIITTFTYHITCLLYTSPSPRDS